eukprot:101999_1
MQIFAEPYPYYSKLKKISIVELCDFPKPNQTGFFRSDETIHMVDFKENVFCDLGDIKDADTFRMLLTAVTKISETPVENVWNLCLQKCIDKLLKWSELNLQPNAEIECTLHAKFIVLFIVDNKDICRNC